MEIHESYNSFINEEVIGKIKNPYNHQTFDMFKNPQTIRNFKAGSRGVLSKTGNLYVADDNGYSILHIDYIIWLYKNGIEKSAKNSDYYLLQKENTKDRFFYLSDSYLGVNISPEFLNDYESAIKLFYKKKHNTNIEFKKETMD